MTFALVATLLAAAVPAPPAEPVAATAPSLPTELDIRSQTLVVRHAERQATFGGGVTAVRGDVTIECPEVLALYDAANRVTVVRCQGEVKALQGDRTIHAGAGEFDNTTGILSLSGEPTLVEGERRIEGELLTYDVATGKAELQHARASFPSGDAPGAARLAGRGPTRITADRVSYDTEGRVARFRGGVRLVRGDLAVQAPQLVAHLDEEGRVVRAVTGGGQVQVVQRERRGTAEKATFNGPAHTLLLEGEPSVTERDSTFAGERITFLLAEDRVEVERPRASFPLREVTGGKRP